MNLFLQWISVDSVKESAKSIRVKMHHSMFAEICVCSIRFGYFAYCELKRAREGGGR